MNDGGSVVAGLSILSPHQIQTMTFSMIHIEGLAYLKLVFLKNYALNLISREMSH